MHLINKGTQSKGGVSVPYDKKIISWLQDQLKNKEHRTDVITMTPTLAKYILDNHHPKQRKLREDQVDKLVKDMKEGEWEFTADPFQFNVMGELINGQHRLNACIKSEISFEAAIAFGLAEAAMNVIDIGAKRSNADALMLHGLIDTSPSVIAGALRWMAILDGIAHRGHPLSNKEILELWNNIKNKKLFKELCNKITEMSRRKNQPTHLKGMKIPSQIILAVCYKSHLLDHNKGEKFLEEITNNISARNLGSKLIQQLNTLQSGREKELTKIAITIKSWNFFARGVKNISKNDLHWSPAEEEFPKMES